MVAWKDTEPLAPIARLLIDHTSSVPPEPVVTVHVPQLPDT